MGVKAGAKEGPAFTQERCTDVTQASPEQTALTARRRKNAERAEGLINQLGIDALAVIGAGQLIRPLQQ
jgi:hypothetical protein